MAFIRLSDDYIDNPKFEHISDGAFRLWHEALAYCRRHSTDGQFPFRTMRLFKHYTKPREQQLTTPWQVGANPLWVLIPGFGYQLHDYLAWNLSKEQEAAKKENAADRMRRFRDPSRVTQRVAARVRAGDGDTNGSEQIPKSLNADARSKRPIFTGQRLTVFEWMLDDCMKVLQEHTDSFDLHEWFFALDTRCVADGIVIPKKDGGAWLQAELVAEAQRRGVPVRFASAAGKQTTRLGTALANIAREQA